MGTLKTAWVLVKGIPEFCTALVEVLANLVVIAILLAVPTLLVFTVIKYLVA